MGKKTKYRYTFNVAKKWKSYDNSFDEATYFKLSFCMAEFDTYTAEYQAKKLAEKGCSTHYAVKVTLKSVEEL